MSSKRLFSGVVLGIGLSLSACAGETGSDVDFGEPVLKPMAAGNGLNGAEPGPECIAGVVKAMTTYPGWSANQNDGGQYNPLLAWVRYNGSIVENPAPNQLLPLDSIMYKTDALEAMTWIGARKTSTITSGTRTYAGNGWFQQDWASSALPVANADLIGGLYAAKWNTKTVDIMVEADGIDGQAVTQFTTASQYNVRESMFVYNPDPGITGQPVLLLFVADTFKAACKGWWDYFLDRTCHDGSCGVPFRAESDVSKFCTKQDGTAASNIAEAYRCLGGHRPVKVSVKSGDLSNDTDCHPLN
ncbi:MAG: hypothetical protein QM820_45310 [Minicystis sp.]